MSREVATETRVCGDCNGAGKTYNGRACVYCDGSGRVETYESRMKRGYAAYVAQQTTPQPALDAGDTYQCDACGKIVPSDEVKSGMPSAGVEGTFCHECRHGKDCDCLGREVDGGAFQRDTSKAITDLTAARESHIAWAAHLRQPHTFECQGCIDHAAHIGDAEYHDEWIVKYDNAIRVLRVAAQIVALPALDAGGEWRYVDTATGAEIVVGEITLRAHWRGTITSEEVRAAMAQIVSDHNAMLNADGPTRYLRSELQHQFQTEAKLVAVLTKARNSAQTFTGAQHLDTARDGLREIARQADAALAPYQTAKENVE